MRARRLLFGLTGGFILIVVLLALHAGSNAIGAESSNSTALTGQVSSSDEGPMEGVLVSAKRAGSTVTTTVASNHEGRFTFPHRKLVPGEYSLRIRAVGYELDN